MCEYVFMRTTIELPDELYKAAKIRAVENQQTLKDLVVQSLQHEITTKSQSVKEPETPYWTRRPLRPKFQALKDNRKLNGGTDATLLLSEDRNSRENALS